MHSKIEALEPRIAPAVLLNPSTLTYVDADGDHVTVKLSKPLLTSVATAENVFHFDTGTIFAAPHVDGTEQQLQLIDLRSVPAAGLNVTVSAKRAGHGDGYAAVGFIDASSDLGVVSIQGDLGGIDAGGANTKLPGLRTLSVVSMGRYGETTQVAGAPSLASKITGSLGALLVRTDVIGAGIEADGIGTVVLGGSLVGGNAAQSGSIESTASITGPVLIGGSVSGGEGIKSGHIGATRNIGAVTIGGSLHGATGTDDPGTVSLTGSIIAGGNLGAVTIGGDVTAGNYDESGKIESGKAIAFVRIGGSLIGGAGNDYTNALSAPGQIGAVGLLGGITIGGSIEGGAGTISGGIYAAKMQRAVIGGDEAGGTGMGSGSFLVQGDVGSVSVKGQLIGGGMLGGNGEAGEIFAAGNVHSIFVGQSIRGGVGDQGGQINVGGSVGAVTIGGSLVGGGGFEAGEVRATGAMGTFSLRHDLVGGTGNSAGRVYAGSGTTASVLIGGSLSGSSGPVSGTVDIEGRIGQVVIGGSLLGGSAVTSGEVLADDSIGSVFIGGSVIGTAANHAAIEVIGHGLKAGAKTDVAIGKITIGGNATYVDMIAGIDGDELGAAVDQNGSAQIGSVVIRGDFTASNIAAGVAPGANGYGTGATPLPNTTPGILSSIGSVIIGGQAQGRVASDASGQIYGITAEHLGGITLGGSAIPLKAGPENDTTPYTPGSSVGLNLYEVG